MDMLGYYTVILLVTVGAVAILLIVVGIVLLKRPQPLPSEPSLPTLDLDTLETGPIPSQPRLEIYHIPMELAAVIVAPAGRGGELPEIEQFPTLFDNLTPGLGSVFDQHQPHLLRWPSQLSSEGFARSFFRHVPLPGSKGRGTPWCSLAGRIESDQESLLIGLLCRANSNNSLAQIFIERPSKWLDIVRVRESD